ncbi:hypothetical protein CSUI_008103 [Cystoisospora suis]|uniref:Uncharacterized protein n=1 Tax=Cystoisospora suis TaxID=483139 RepID=A0A2C6KB59_9APIC|nr:hypothetical protein CSUI_008103 [Cystoisospora suis]
MDDRLASEPHMSVHLSPCVCVEAVHRCLFLVTKRWISYGGRIELHPLCMFPLVSAVEHDGR